MQKHSFNLIMAQQSSLFRCIHQSRLNTILGKYNRCEPIPYRHVPADRV